MSLILIVEAPASAPPDVQARVQVREVEGLVHFVGPDPVRQAGQRIHIGFGAQDAVQTILGKDLTQPR